MLEIVFTWWMISGIAAAILMTFDTIRRYGFRGINLGAVPITFCYCIFFGAIALMAVLGGMAHEDS